MTPSLWGAIIRLWVGTMHIVDSTQESLLKGERKFLDDLRTALLHFGATPEDQEALGQSIQQLDELFLLVVVGEFNSGKSALINVLLGLRAGQKGKKGFSNILVWRPI